ncbi:MAG: D-alanyl-D-alanine carboxypeptidase/D-alanyl-D-alanine endopeptidase [Paracoccaceae bacterium]
MKSRSVLNFSRRAVLAGLAAGFGQTALAKAPPVSPVPLVRPKALKTVSIAGAQDLIARARLGGKIGFVLSDARTGQVLEAINPVLGLPPASVLKTVTAQYALDTLGPAHVFVTRLIGTGPMLNGRLEGDLVLLGGGDPTLNTNGLAEMAAALKSAGLREVAGRFLVHGGALPHVDRIDADQPDYLGYNPAVSGLNLNYNRVYFEWKKAGGTYSVTMDARSARFRPEVTVAQMQIADRRYPVYTYSNGSGVETWTVARAALGNGGARWLPVRLPELYAGEVFQILAKSHGIELSAPSVTKREHRGKVLVSRQSPTLAAILKGMLKSSNNFTAEIAGLSASVARGRPVSGLVESGSEMARWMRDRLEARKPRFVDHSGLGGGSRLSASDMVAGLVRIGPDSTLASMLKRVPMRDGKGNLRQGKPVEMRAKTGTLNFVSGLAGFIMPEDGRDLAFAIFSADMARRAAIPEADRERPRGARSWSGQARRLQWGLIDRWVELFG